MDDIIIPGWAILIIPVVVGWMVWLTIELFNNKQSIAINSANDKKVGDELEKLYTTLEKNKQELSHSIDKLANKLDMFLGNEMTFLKDVIKTKL